jgi:inner membrane protein
MDNVTHALAGMLLAEVVVQHRAGRESSAPGWGRWAYVVSTVANNLPDLDILYIGITGGKLGYLAHHRGHTHTLVFALVQAAFVVGGVWLLRRRMEAHADSAADGGRWSKKDWRWITVVAAVGPLLHLAMDAGNNYGVHPFWPIDSSWHYGDRMFIVEPLLWAGVAPVLAVAVASRAAKIGLALLALAGVALSWFTGFVPTLSAVAVTATTLIAAGLALRLTARHRAALAVGVALAVYAVFIGVGARVRQLVEDAIASDAADERLVDAALAPLPANPRCWSLNSLSVTADDVVLRRGVVLPFGGEPDELCPARFGEPTAPLVLATGLSEGLVRVQRIMRYPRAALTGLASHCQAAAFFRWSRLPFHHVVDGRTVLGDLRYDFDDSLGWAEITVAADDVPCPRFVPGWTPPREELLSTQ